MYYMLYGVTRCQKPKTLKGGCETMQTMWQYILWAVYQEDVHRMLQRYHAHASKVLRTDTNSLRKTASDEGGVYRVQIQVRRVAHTESILLSSANMLGLHSRTTPARTGNEEEREAR